MQLVLLPNLMHSKLKPLILLHEVSHAKADFLSPTDLLKWLDSFYSSMSIIAFRCLLKRCPCPLQKHNTHKIKRSKETLRLRVSNLQKRKQLRTEKFLQIKPKFIFVDKYGFLRPKSPKKTLCFDWEHF